MDTSRKRPGDRFSPQLNDQSRRRTHGDVISPAAKRLSRQRTRCLVADAAYHRRPYFAGVLRARATSQPLATLRDMLTLPILFCFPPGPSPRRQGYHTPYGRILQVLSQRFWGKFFPPRFETKIPSGKHFNLAAHAVIELGKYFLRKQPFLICLWNGRGPIVQAQRVEKRSGIPYCTVIVTRRQPQIQIFGGRGDDSRYALTVFQLAAQFNDVFRRFRQAGRREILLHELLERGNAVLVGDHLQTIAAPPNTNFHNAVKFPKGMVQPPIGDQLPPCRVLSPANDGLAGLPRYRHIAQQNFPSAILSQQPPLASGPAA